MGLEYVQAREEPTDFTNAAEVPVISTRTEQAPFRLDGGAAARDEARREDARWVGCMYTLAEIAGQVGVVSLSDGITSHVVNSVGVLKGPEDYLLLYDDPWGPERGSFLQRGKNVAGCAATLHDGSGTWAIRAGELYRVLDSAYVFTP